MRLKTFKTICFDRLTKFDLITRTLLLAGVFVFGIQASCLSQERTISGTVKSADGLPLSGVSIQVKGTKQGTSTDDNGKYSLQVKEGAILMVSAANNISKEVSVGRKSTFDIVLEQDIKT